jgi:hypothetical protein
MSEPTATDLARWAKWDDLRAREARATTDEEKAALAIERDQLEDASTKELLKQDMSKEMQWFWLSFRDVDTDTNLGVTIVEGGGVMEATLNAMRLDANPGGEVLAYPLEPEHLPAEYLRNRLLSERELAEAGLLAEQQNGGAT